MKKLFLFPALIATLSLFVACPKQQTEEEKNAEVERQVQERLAAERQTQQQQQLDQRQAELDAREKALAQNNNATAPPAEDAEREESRTTVESRARLREPRERSINVGYSTFYNKLEPYGDWIETNDYGYVFHPRQAEGSRSWRPYTQGRWVYTDVGWTWMSEEPFGWATYHYGRWTRLRGVGWVWVPGNEWAPAWVSWRKSSDYVGWAPLPPEARFDQRTGIHNWSDNYYDVGPDQYCFVASREFGAPRVEQTLLPPERSVTIVNQTTNVTNITYNNTTIVNEGPSYDEMRSISREPVQRYRLERNANVDFASEPPRSEMRGETIVIAAPVIARPVANERPSTVKQTIAAAAFDLGWASIANQDDAKKTRQKMKSEATPPPNAPSKKFVKAESTTSATTAQSAETSSATTAPARATAAPSAAVTATAAPVTSAPARATAAPSAAATATAARPSTPVATIAPSSTPQPRHSATIAPAASAAATSSPAVSPTASQRRGRLLLPSATPSLRTTPSASATPQPTANSPVATNSITPTPIPSASPVAPVGSGRGANPRARSQAPRPTFGPRNMEPMPSASLSRSEASSPGAGSPEGGSTSSPSGTSGASPTASSASTTTPAEKLTKHEKKEQKREQRQEMKRERQQGNATPSATP